MTQLTEKDFSTWGSWILKLSETLKKATTSLKIRAAHELERSEAILEKHGEEK
jgi:hypothetical protein